MHLRHLAALASFFVSPGLMWGAETAPATSTPLTGYHLTAIYPVGGEGGWDFISVDPDAERLYISHGAVLDVLDAATGKLLGQIANTPGVHGAAIAADLKRGFTSNGRDKSVTIFDTTTLKTLKKVSVNEPDFILYDPFTQRVFPMNEKITVLDAKTGDKVGEVNLGGEPEAAASDGNGTLYVNLEDKGALAVVDARTLKVTRTYPIEGCTAPHSLSFDRENRRVLIGCVDGFAALDANTGKVVAHSLMCSGVDSGGFDPQRHLIFESCGEGVISVLRQVSPDYYQLVDTVKTQLRARTMTFDVKTKKIYLPTADVDLVPNPDPKADSPFRQKLTPGSFRVLVVEP